MGRDLGPRSFALASVLALVTLAALAACSGSSSHSPPSGSGSSSGGGSSGGSTSGGSDGFPIADHPPLPQVNDNGGGIITAIEVVTVTFDTSLYTNVTSPSPAQLVADLQSFDDTITQTAWWDTVRAGYCEPLGSSSCVGRGTTLPAAQGHVSIATAPAASYTDSASAADATGATLKTYIGGLLSAGTLPAPTASTLYVFYFPSSTSIVSEGQTSCSDFGGYHTSVSYQGADVPYAIVPVCDPEATTQGVAQLTHEQTATFAASHEIIESATDPHVDASPPHLGFYLTDPASQAWTIILGGGEIADLCVDPVGVGEDRSTQGSWTVQRVWNNVSAAASHDPCVPIPDGEVYFNVAPPKADEMIAMSTLGQTTTFTATGFSDGAMASWTVEVIDIGQSSPGVPSNILSTTPSKASANNGSSVPVTITLESALPAQNNGGTFEPFLIASLGTGTTYHLWPGMVVAPQ